ncbi:phosphotransferase [Candidiatus Paracoxiella cheracis]|uniref:phosphotransferase n=1 Tax=Candidiatus Paracoxiella cheracis TaxID=3405120 RepID=UPI003BF491A8
MTFELTQPLLDRVCKQFNLGEIITKPIFIPGGKVHQVWKLQTKKGAYALKRLAINTSPSLVALYRETQKIAEIFQKNNIPVVTALLHKNDPVCFLNNNYFMLFDWVQGEKISPQQALRDHAGKMGWMLAQMHQLHLSPTLFDVSVLNEDFYSHVFSEEKWQNLVENAIAQRIAYADKLKNTLPLILKVCHRAEQATERLKSKRIIAHRDASPNNVIWPDHQSPIIIDWELAGLIHPTVDLLGGAFDWSVVKSEEVSTKRFKAFVSAYHAGGGRAEHTADAFEALIGIWFSWMEFNLVRFVNAENSVQQELGEREVIHTLMVFHTVYSEQNKWIKLVEEL